MRIIVAAFLLLHGIAHLVGFLAPWGLLPAPKPGAAPPPSANLLFGGHLIVGQSAARVLGTLWLIVAVGFAAVAYGIWRDAPWTLPALVIVALSSLLLCVMWWPVTKIGLAVNTVLLAALIIVGYLGYREDVRVERDRVRSGSTILDTKAGPIEYATLGKGTPILVLHGTGGGWDQSLWAAGDLAKYGFHLIAPSRFGYLRTPLPNNPSPQAEADAWAFLLDALGVERVAVMSFSAGTAPALQFALRHPERVTKLVLFVPAAGGIMPAQTSGPPAFVMNVVLKYDFPMWAAMHVSPKTMLNLVAVPASLVPSLSQEEKAELNDAIRRLLPVSQRRQGIMNDAKTQSGFELYPLSQLTVPTLLISAEDDLYRTLRVARHATRTIPNAQLIEFKSGGHLLIGRREEVWPAVAAFINERTDQLKATTQ